MGLLGDVMDMCVELTGVANTAARERVGSIPDRGMTFDRFKLRVQ